MVGAPITVTCECGDRRPLRYGERWTCVRCGRTWNTAQIPPEEYRRTMRPLRRYRLAVWGITAAVVGTLVPLALLLSYGIFVLAILTLGALYFLVLPKWRGRLLAQMRDRPTWELHPE